MAITRISQVAIYRYDIYVYELHSIDGELFEYFNSHFLFGGELLSLEGFFKKNKVIDLGLFKK